jgi:hypothetical protein
MAENANDFHYKVSDYLKAKGWDVEISPYYVDLIKQRSREIDIVACKEYPIITRFPRRRAKLQVRLFTECKWILPTVSVYLNFLPKDEKLAINLARDNDILRQKFYAPLEGLSGEPLRVHHYIQPKEVVRTAICENKGKGSRNNDIFFDAWEQALHALLYYKHYTPKRWIPVDKEFVDTIYIIDYSVVVVSSFDTFYKRDWISKMSSQINDNFIWSVNYSYPVLSNNEQRHIRKDFFVDITSFPTFEGFLENLEQNDVAILKEKIWVNLMS